MCLIIFLYDTHPDYRLILAANRDEFYDRPTSPLAFWDDTPAVLAGRDLRGNGTWLGITKNGRIAAITNFREPALVKLNAPSRGLLLSDYLTGTKTPKIYLKHIKTIGHRYNGFNLVLGDSNGFYYYSNKTEKIKELKPGLYGLSNHLLDTPWPNIFNLLADRTLAPDDRLPDTGIGLKWEQILSSPFITSDTYGTRSSSIILIDRNHKVAFSERSLTPEETGSFKQKTRRFNFQISREVAPYFFLSARHA